VCEVIIASDSKSLSPELEFAILRLWAQGLSLSQQFGEAEIRSIPGLAAAIDAIRALPSAIGRDEDDDVPDGATVLFLDRRSGLQRD
jgi:hypothetical protein